MYETALQNLVCYTFANIQFLEPAFFVTSVLMTHVVEILEVRVQIALVAREVRDQLPVWRPLAMPYWPY